MLLGLGPINKNIIPIIIGSVFAFFNRLLFTSDVTILFNHAIIINIYVSASRILAVIPFIIFKIKSTRNKNSHKNIMNNNVELLYKNPTKALIKDQWKYILLSSAIFFIQSILMIYSMKIKSNFWIFEIIFTCIFYYLIFKIKLYKHHYLSIVIIILTGLIIDLSFKNLQNDIIDNWPFLLLRLLREILFSLREVIDKYIMEKKFCSIYELSMYNGLINLILLGIFSILNYYYFSIDNFEEYFNNFNGIELLVLIGMMITQFGLYICSLFTSKNNTPCHVFIIYIFGQLAYYTDFSTNSIIFIICLIFILFISLIFNEIIEIKCFGLEENTRNNIAKRAKIEELKIQENSSLYAIDDNLSQTERDEESHKSSIELFSGEIMSI